MLLEKLSKIPLRLLRETSFIQRSVKATSCIDSVKILRRYSSKPHIVQMRGLDYETREEDVVEFFEPLGITPKQVRLKCDGAGRVSPGVSEVEFATHAEAVVAMRKKNAFMGNRFIRLSLDSVEDETSAPSDSQQIEQNEALLKVGLKIVGNIDRTNFATGHFIHMRNAPKRITEQAIFQFFKPVGVSPISIKHIYDEFGSKIGEFEIEFLTHEDAIDAMVKNNAYLGKKFVELELRSSPKPDASNIDDHTSNLQTESQATSI